MVREAALVAAFAACGVATRAPAPSTHGTIRGVTVMVAESGTHTPLAAVDVLVRSQRVPLQTWSAVVSQGGAFRLELAADGYDVAICRDGQLLRRRDVQVRSTAMTPLYVTIDAEDLAPAALMQRPACAFETPPSYH